MTLAELPARPVRVLEHIDSDPASIRAAFGRFPSGLAALCARIDDVPTGLVASSFSVGASYDPPLVMFSVQNSSTTWPKLRTAPSIGISILGRDQSGAASQLASRSRDRFADLDIEETDEGALLIHGSVMWLETRLMSETPAGDHQIVLLEVTRLSVEHEIEPLIYHAQGFHGLQAAG